MANSDKTWVVSDNDPLKIETYNSNRLWRRDIAVTRYGTDAKRIIYCVNALKGIERPRDFVEAAKSNERILELNKKHINSLELQICDLETQNKELIEFLKEINNLTESGGVITKGSIISFSLKQFLIKKP